MCKPCYNKIAFTHYSDVLRNQTYMLFFIFVLATNQQCHRSAGCTVRKYFLRPTMGTPNSGLQDCIVIVTEIMMISHTIQSIHSITQFIFLKNILYLACDSSPASVLQIMETGTQTLTANSWPIWVSIHTLDFWSSSLFTAPL